MHRLPELDQAGTVRSQVLLPRIDDVCDEVCEATYFSKINRRFGYHQVRIKNTDVLKKVSRTRYGRFEYSLTPLRLSKAKGCFQTPMDDNFKSYLDKRY